MAPIRSHKKHEIGSSFDDFLDKHGIFEECEYQALKEMLADQVRQAKAERMQTSRRQLDRLLDLDVAVGVVHHGRHG